MPAFQGNVQFNISVKRLSTTTNVPIDLSEMGTQPRTLANVINYINGKLAGDGFTTRFASQRLPNEPRTVKVGTQTVHLPAIADSDRALKINGDTSEQVTFSAPATAGAVYIAQSAGTPPSVADLAKGVVDTTQRQILKFQTDTTDVPANRGRRPVANWVDGRVNIHPDLGPGSRRRPGDQRPARMARSMSWAIVTDATDGQEPSRASAMWR